VLAVSISFDIYETKRIQNNTHTNSCTLCTSANIIIADGRDDKLDFSLRPWRFKSFFDYFLSDHATIEFLYSVKAGRHDSDDTVE